MCCDPFNCGSRQVKRDPLDLLMEDYDIALRWQIYVTMPSFKLQFSLGFITSCYVIFSLSMVQAMDIFMIT